MSNVPDRGSDPRRNFRVRAVELATEPIQKGYMVEHWDGNSGGFYQTKSANEALNMHLKASKKKKGK